MAEQHSTNPESIHEELTAYLDGELDAEGVRRVEDRLARDTAYHGELQRLEKTWDLLDRLPRAPVSESFTNSTIEMVAVAACEEAAVTPDMLRRDRRRQWLLGLGSSLAAGLVGFAIGHWAWPNSNQQLLEDLPVLQNFELYYQADNIDFLRLLEKEGLFAEAEGDHAG